MKQIKHTRFIIVLLLLAVELAAQHSHYPDKPSTHGMLIMGTGSIYASHLPMFHSPHDYQIILELELDESSKQEFISDQQLHPEYSAYTIEPETFVLPEMIDHPRPFKANIYRGHFERGGTRIIENITVNIKRVIYFKKFNPAENKLVTTDFILFGNSNEQFSAHQLSNKPDFEQILKIKTGAVVSTPDKNHITVSLNTSENTPIGISGNEVTAVAGDKKIYITLLKQLYLEFDDLKE